MMTVKLLIADRDAKGTDQPGMAGPFVFRPFDQVVHAENYEFALERPPSAFRPFSFSPLRRFSSLEDGGASERDGGNRSSFPFPSSFPSIRSAPM